jgi:putative membrane protein insertion efficiency factor
MKRALLLTIRLYQRFFSPLLLPACRYVPTCSQYAHQAVELHGPAKGSLLAAWRLLRCHPLARGGYDPVPHNNCDPVLHTNSEGHGGTCPERSRGSRAVHPHSHIRALAPEAKEII